MTARRLEGRIALVTGAAAGIGASTARRLHEEGAVVLATDVDAESPADQFRDLDDNRLHTYDLDVRHADAWRAVVNEALNRWGRIDVLINNAGISRGQAVEEETEEGWDRVVDVSLRGVWLGMRSVAPFMRAARAASIVNVSSILAVRGGAGTNVAYHASKGGVSAMTRNAAIRFARDGIRVNAVLPGYIATAALLEGLDRTGQTASVRASVPMARFGAADEVASAVAFLASDDSSYVTGSELVVDGGVLAG